MANTITFQEEVNRAKEAQKRWMITFAVIMVAVGSSARVPSAA